MKQLAYLLHGAEPFLRSSDSREIPAFYGT